MMRECLSQIRVALLFVGGAILLSACKENKNTEQESRYDALMTEYSENRTVIASENGIKQYQFFAPLLEGYTAGNEPYREFRKGIRMTTFKKDSSGEVDVTLTANYAIYYETRKLWEAKGNVVVKKFDGKRLYTEQLFWNDVTNKIYSNVDSKIVEPDGETFVSGFESDEEFRYWSAREMDGRMEMEFKPTPPDSTAVKQDSVAADVEKKATSSRQKIERPSQKSIVPPRPGTEEQRRNSQVRTRSEHQRRDSETRRRLAAPPKREIAPTRAHSRSSLRQNGETPTLTLPPTTPSNPSDQTSE